jgi:hypothetical protein
VLFYAVVGAQTEKVVEFFLEREAAEAMIREAGGTTLNSQARSRGRERDPTM